MAAQNGDSGFNVMEPDKYSLSSLYSEESLGGARLKMIVTIKNVNDNDEQEIDNKTINA